MAIFLLIAIILSFGGAALLTAFVKDGLPFVFFSDTAEFSFLGTAAIYAALILLVFVIIAVLVSLKKKKPSDSGTKLFENITELKNLAKSNGHGIGTMSSEVDAILKHVTGGKGVDAGSELNAILVRMEEQNETVPLLKRLLADSEEEKGRLIVEISEKKTRITELEVSNEQLEKNNLSLQRVIDNALEPYREKSDD